MAGTLTGRERYRTYTDDIDWSSVNVNDRERWVSTISGGGLVAYGLARRNWGGLALAALGGILVYRGVTGRCPAYHALGVSTNNLGRVKVRTDRAIKIEKRILVNRSPDKLYRYWRNFENLPRFLKHVDSVKVKDDRHSHWVVRAPLGIKLEWDAEIISEIPNELIGWRSVGQGDVDNAGSVRFVTDVGGTEVRVILQYVPPGGLAGAAMAKILGEDPEEEVEEDLRRFKQIMERGESPATLDQPADRAAGNFPS